MHDSADMLQSSISPPHGRRRSPMQLGFSSHMRRLHLSRSIVVSSRLWSSGRGEVVGKGSEQTVELPNHVMTWLDVAWGWYASQGPKVGHGGSNGVLDPPYNLDVARDGALSADWRRRQGTPFASCCSLTSPSTSWWIISWVSSEWV